VAANPFDGVSPRETAQAGRSPRRSAARCVRHPEPLPNGLGGGEDRITGPPLWQLLAVAPGTVLVVAALTTIPARLGTPRPTAEILQAELT
jgi:hypothetical protein